MSAKLEREEVVRHHHCGRAGTMKLQAVFDCFQDVAAEHAQLLGCGLEALRDAGQLWVLSRLRVKFLRFPRLGERLKISTWPSGAEKLFATRQYELSAAEIPLLQASSAWLVLDAASARPLPASKVVSLPPNADLPRFFGALGKISAPPEKLPPLRVHIVGEADIDMNAHLNNAVYARFVEDALGILAPEKTVSELQINFLRAQKVGAAVETSGTTDGNNFFVGGECFEAAGFFQ